MTDEGQITKVENFPSDALVTSHRQCRQQHPSSRHRGHIVAPIERYQIDLCTDTCRSTGRLEEDITFILHLLRAIRAVYTGRNSYCRDKINKQSVGLYDDDGCGFVCVWMGAGSYGEGGRANE